MKLFGRFHEMSLNQVSLYHTPIGEIKDIMDKHPEMQVIVKEYRPRKNTREVGKSYTQLRPNRKMKVVEQKETVIFHPDFAKIHQVTLVNDLGFMKISLYSEPTNHQEVEKYLKLKPVPEAKKKEKLEMTISKLDPNTAHEREFHVEHVKANKSKKK
jgi:hypothetical protein